MLTGAPAAGLGHAAGGVPLLGEHTVPGAIEDGHRVRTLGRDVNVAAVVAHRDAGGEVERVAVGAVHRDHVRGVARGTGLLRQRPVAGSRSKVSRAPPKRLTAYRCRPSGLTATSTSLPRKLPGRESDAGGGAARHGRLLRQRPGRQNAVEARHPADAVERARVDVRPSGLTGRDDAVEGHAVLTGSALPVSETQPAVRGFWFSSPAAHAAPEPRVLARRRGAHQLGASHRGELHESSPCYWKPLTRSGLGVRPGPCGPAGPVSRRGTEWVKMVAASARGGAGGGARGDCHERDGEGSTVGWSSWAGGGS